MKRIQNMKISLINPNLSGDVSCYDIGLTYVATYLNERTKHESKIIDYTFHRRHWEKHLLKKLKEQNPDVIGITTVSLYVRYIKDTIKLIRTKYSGTVPIILGGYHATLDPEGSMGMGGVNAICIGNGEHAFTEYLDALEEGKSLKGIKGIWYKEAGEVIKNEKRPLLQDVDSLPIPDYDLWEDMDKYLYFLGQGYFVGVRGCPFNCSYCSEYTMKQIFGVKGYIRKRNPRAFAREIQYQYEKYKDRGMRIAHCFDPVFVFDKEWLREFSDEYQKIGMASKLPLSVFAEATAVDEEKIRLLSEANGKVIRIGVEAGNEEIRMKVYEKIITDGQLKEAFKTCHKYDFAITAYNMLGGPGESKKTLKDTFNMNKELNAGRPIFFIYRPLPNTRAMDKIKAMGNTIDACEFDKIDSLHFGAALNTGNLKPKDVVRYQKKMFAYFLTKRIFKLIKTQKLKFFTNMIGYGFNGMRYGLSFPYIVGYFLSNCGDNLTT